MSLLKGFASQSPTEESARAEILRLRFAPLRMTAAGACHPELVEGSRLTLSHSGEGECRDSSLRRRFAQNDSRG